MTIMLKDCPHVLLTHWPLGDFNEISYKVILLIDGWDISCEIAFRWLCLNHTDEKQTLVHIMAWCHQATRHYLSQCWSRSILPYGVTRPQWVQVFGILWINLLWRLLWVLWNWKRFLWCLLLLRLINILEVYFFQPAEWYIRHKTWRHRLQERGSSSVGKNLCIL